MLPGGIIKSLVETVRTMINQRKCRHDWREYLFRYNLAGLYISYQNCHKLRKTSENTYFTLILGLNTNLHGPTCRFV